MAGSASLTRLTGHVVDYLPLFFNLKNRPCLIVGGGEIAVRKARLLQKVGAQIDVVAEEVKAELESIAGASNGKITRGEYSSSLLRDHVLVISATNIRKVNEQVANDCRQRNIPVNVVDNLDLCTVVMPAIVDRSPLLIGITSGGESPVLARRIRSQLESTIPGAYGELAKLASRFRQQVKATFTDGELRRRFWESVINGPIAEQALSGNMDAAVVDLEKKLAQKNCETEGEVYLVGAGPGDPDLLTFKALRLMQQAEVVLHDRLVSPPILDMVRRDAQRIYVGKRRSEHTVPQQQINQMMVDLAKQGKRVLRLKGGDPFIFGRGGEEIDLLAENKIPFQVVPGITAANACACYAGIPLTHRDYSQSVRFITGHLKEGETNLRWSEFVDARQTLVFYMGLAGLDQICSKLIDYGKDPRTPAALVERGTLPNQQVHVSDLENLPEVIRNREVHAPTLLIIGDVVQLHKKLSWYKI